MRALPTLALAASLLSLASTSSADTWLYVSQGDPLKWFPGSSEPDPGWFATSYASPPSWKSSDEGYGIGYGDGDDSTLLTDMMGNYLTVYVRSHFQVGAELGSLKKLMLRVQYDDAFAAYVNGKEVARVGLPAGALTHGTAATTGHDVTDGAFTIELDPTLLVPGDNVFAAQVHNASLGSSDLSFLPSLWAYDQPPPEAVITRGPFVQKVGRHSATVVWETDQPAPSRVLHGPSSAMGHAAEDASLVRHHAIELTGLPSASPVWYQVQSASLPSKQGKLTTEPDVADAFRIVVFGDTRSNHDDHRAVVHSILPGMPQLVFHSGDLVGDGLSSALWDTFFKIEAPLIRDVPLYPVMGNHENNAQEFFDTFELPDNSPSPERYYAVRWSTLLVAMLDLYGSAYDDQSAQYAWLEKTLADAAKDPGILHRMVGLHHGPYDSGSHGSSSTVRSRLVPLFEKYGVELVFSGHDHDYERGTVNGIKYVVSGGGGAPLYPVDGASWTESKAMKLHHVLIEFRGPMAEARVVEPDGTEIDFFTIGKKGSECASATECKTGAPGTCPAAESGAWACVEGTCLWNCHDTAPVVDAGADSAPDSASDASSQSDAWATDGASGVDASQSDASMTVDGGQSESVWSAGDDGGCGCRAANARGRAWGWIAVLGLGGVWRRRERRRAQRRGS